MSSSEVLIFGKITLGSGAELFAISSHVSKGLILTNLQKIQISTLFGFNEASGKGSLYWVRKINIMELEMDSTFCD